MHERGFLHQLTIPYDDVTATIERQGIEKFSASFDEMTALLENKLKDPCRTPAVWRNYEVAIDFGR